MMDPIQELMDEHRIIEKVLAALSAAASREAPVQFYREALDFIVNFADKCHHGKEEQRLFPMLEDRGIPNDGGPIGVMCQEHDVGREHVRRMQASIAAGDMETLRRESVGYVALLRDHIQKEDNILYPMGQNILSKADLEILRAQFDEVESRLEYNQRYTRVAEKLMAQVGIE